MPTLLIQQVVNQREERPKGWRIWTDGLLQRTSDDNPLPGPTDRLDVDRELAWVDVRQLDESQLAAVRTAVEQAKFFDLPPRLTINYCKEDPGAAIWTVNLDGNSARVVVYDPRPKRNAALDALNDLLRDLLKDVPDQH